MLHVRLNGFGRQSLVAMPNATTVAPATTDPGQVPPGNAVFIPPTTSTNTQPVNPVVVQPPPPPPPDPGNIDPATGLPWTKPDPNIDPVTGAPIMPDIASSKMADPRKAPTPPLSGYSCVIDKYGLSSCIGTGLTDLQFHTLQDLLNKTQQRIRDLSGGTYVGPSIAVNGIVDISTSNSLAKISASGAVPSLSLYDVHINPQWICDNAASLIASMQMFLGTYVDPTASYATFVNSTPPSGGSSFNPGGNPAVQSYTCSDGSIVTDPNACPATPSPGSTPTPPFVDPGSVPGVAPAPSTMPVVIGLSPVGTAVVGVLALLVGAFVIPKLFR